MSNEVLTEVRNAASAYNGLTITSRNETSTVQSPLGSESPTVEMDLNGSDNVSAKSNSLVVVRSLKNELVRFRLLGPRSHAILMETLKPKFGSIISESQSTESISQTTTSESTKTDHPDIPEIPEWWEGHTHMEAHSKILASCYHALKMATNPTQFSRGTVIGMTVRDPRLFTPSKKADMVSAHYPKKKRDAMFELLGSTEKYSDSASSEGSESECSEESRSGVSEGADTHRKSPEDLSDEDDSWDDLSDTEEIQELPMEVEMGQLTVPAATQQHPLTDLPPGVAYSPIWDEDTRKMVSKSKAPDHLLNRARSKQFVKSSELKLGKKAAHIPVLLIQQNFQLQPIPNMHTGGSTSSNHNVGAGWDLVLPSNWAMAFWVSLIYRGARACAMQDLRHCSLEALVPHFPKDYIDTESGRVYSQQSRQLLEEKFRRYPPDKRRNYGKLLIPNPFHAPWPELIKTWNTNGTCSRLLHESGVETIHTNRKRGQFFNESGVETTLQPPPTKQAKLSAESSPKKEWEHQVPSPTSQQLQETQGHDHAADEIDQRRIETAVQTTEVLNSAESQLASPAEFYVLRCRDTLAKINCLLCDLFSQRNQKISPRQLPMERSTTIQQQIKEHGIETCLTKHSSALIPVRLEILHRGDLHDRAMICIPTTADLKTLSENTSFQPSETVHPKGMTVVEGESIVIGTSLLPKKEVKDMHRHRKKRAKQAKANGDRNPRGKLSF